MPDNKTVAKTNLINNSQKTVRLDVITFSELWQAYPAGVIEHRDPETRKDVFSDHCAINVSEALYQCGILMKSFKKTRCWSCPHPDPVTRKGRHVIRAQELSDYLKARPFAGCPHPLAFTGKNYLNGVEDKTGIIFFQDYWLRGSEKTPTGDHIDLWDKGKLAGSGSLASFLRVNLPDTTETLSGIFGANMRISSLEKSKQVLFWEIE